MEPAIHLFSEADLQAIRLLPIRIVDAVEEAIRRQIAGEIRATPKAGLFPGDGRYMMTTLSFSDDPPISVVKCVTVCPDNPSNGRPAIDGSIMVHDSRTGALRAVMDAKWVTAVRTAALSGLAARRLADPDATHIGFVGAGVQARAHLDMLAALFPIREVSVYGRGKPNVVRLAEAAREKGLSVAVCADPRAAIAGADIVVSSVTANTLKAPFLDAGWLKPGAFAASADLGAPWRPERLASLDFVLIDDKEQEATKTTKLVPDHLVGGDLQDLVSGRVDVQHVPARTSAFVFRGIGVGDFALAALILAHAAEA